MPGLRRRAILELKGTKNKPQMSVEERKKERQSEKKMFID
jgi:hypothetical protein